MFNPICISASDAHFELYNPRFLVKYIIMAYVIVLKAPFVKNVNNLNENKILTAFKSVDELNIN